MLNLPDFNTPSSAIQSGLQQQNPPEQKLNVGMPVMAADDEPLSIDSGTASPVSSVETMDKRSSKFKYGLGDLLQKTKDEIYQNLQDGRENELRASAATTIDERRRTASEGLIARVANNKQAPLSQEEKDGLIGMVNSLNQSTDPNTVLETAYGRQFMSTLDRTAENTDDNILTDAKKVAPEAVAKTMEVTSSLATKHQIIDTMLDDAKDRAKNQGWISWGYDKVKGAIPGYEEEQLRGLGPGVGFFTGGFLGANLEESRKAFLRLSPEELQTKLKAVVDPLMEHNPGMAVDLLESMAGMSSSDIFYKNMSLPVNLLGLYGGGSTGKGVTKAVVGGEKMAKDISKATFDMAKASSASDASKSTAEAASGDLTSSAVTRATTNAIADTQNVPHATRRAVESLSNTFRADLEDARANPGTRGQDIVNRIEERSNTVTTQLIDTAINIQKIDRLPDVLANESSVRLIIEDIKDKYVGLKNSIIDDSGIYREPLSTNYLIDFNLGKTDGSYFTQRSVAENFIEFHGLKDASIETGTKLAKTSTGREIAKLDKNIQDMQVAQVKSLADSNLSDPKAAAKAKEDFDGWTGLITNAEAKRGEAMERHAETIQRVSVEQQGLGYYIKITKPVDETRPVIRQAIAQTSNTQIPDSPITFFLNNWVGKYVGAAAAKLRTPEEVLSLAERQNRLTSTYAPSSYFKIMVENSKEIQGLRAGRFSKGRKRWVEWQRGLENAQELPDALDPERTGYFFKSPGEMEGYWQQWFHRLPDEQEIAAYFEFKRGMEIDRVFRNIAEHRNQQRVGSETHNVIVKDAKGQDVKSPDFNGVIRKKVPGAADNIVTIGEKLGDEKITALDRMSVKAKQEMQKDIDRGSYKLVEFYSPELRSLSGFGAIRDERIRYALVPQMETRALDWNHIPRRGGGHIDHDYDFWIKQAKIKYDAVGDRHWYENDTTIMAALTHGIGRGVAENLNKIRLLLKDKQEDAARNLSNSTLHVDWDTVRSWFKGKLDAEGKFQPPHLSLSEEIKVVPKGKRIIDIDDSISKKYANFRDGTREGSLARQNQVQYSQERDAFELLAVNVEGTRANPLYKVAPADKIDVLTTMNRGLTRIAQSNFMDDYKTMAVEHWLAQAAPFLDAKSRAEIYNSPHYFFNEGKFKSATPADVRLRLEASKYHTQQLTGQPSTTDALLHSATQKLADSMLSTFGPKGMIITPTWLLPKLKDPFAFARGIAFDVKLGLFNIPQFIVQAGNYANIMGIAGYKYASPGTLGAQLHFWSTVNSHPNIINHLDMLASKFNLPGTAAWRPGEFKEGFQEMAKTGFGNVGGEYAALDDMTNKVFQGAGSTFLEWGRYPFKAGERNARYGAWYTAFKEFRDANPIGRITNEDRASILQRADLLNVNMSRASSSAIHKGIWSIPTQFYTYQIRLMELMFGNRLTMAERGKLFATNAALFGVPMATGLTGLPVADYIRRKALENNYVVGDDFLQSMFMEGVPSAIGAVISGKGDPAAGTYYDIGPRFGTKGLEFLGSAQQMDKGWLDVAGGPIYSIVKDFYAQTDGMRYAVLSLARRDEEVFPMVVEDMADAFKEITMVNSAWRVYAATQFGRWVSKKDAYLADSSPAQAVFAAAFGVKDENITDITIKNNSLKVQAQYEKGVEDQFRQEFRRGVLAQKGDNTEMAKKFFTRAQAWLEIGGYREDRINSLVGKAIRDNESVMDKTNWDFYLRKSPDDVKQGRFSAFQRTMKLQDKKAAE